MKKYRIIYSFLIVVSFLFAAVYKGNLSTVIFITVIVLPVLTFFIQFIGFTFLKIYIDEGTDICQKEQSFRITVYVKNSTLFAFAPLKITALIPGAEEKYKEAELIFSLEPFAKTKLNLSYCLKYRGRYRFSLVEVCCYDLLKIFRLKRTLSIEKDIIVLPRHFILEGDGAKNLSDRDYSAYSINDRNGSEMNFVRRYQEGDSFRQIHWNLSAKHDEYMVRQMANNKNNSIVIFCDLNAYALTPEENSDAADTAIEAALALSYQAVQNEEEATNCWYDTEKNALDCACITDGAEFWQQLRAYSTVKTYSGKAPFTWLITSLLEQIPHGGLIYLITPAGDAQLAELASKLTANSSGVIILTTGKSENSAMLSLKDHPSIRFADLYKANIVEAIYSVQETKRK